MQLRIGCIWIYFFLSDTVQGLVLVLLFLWRSQSALPNQHWLESQNANLESYASVHVKCFLVWEYCQPTVTHNELITNTHTHINTHTRHAHIQTLTHTHRDTFTCTYSQTHRCSTQLGGLSLIFTSMHQHVQSSFGLLVINHRYAKILSVCIIVVYLCH